MGTRKPTKKKPTKTAPASVVASAFAVAKQLNPNAEYKQSKHGSEELVAFPHNSFAEKIVVRTSPLQAGTVHIEMYRITGGEKRDVLSFASNGSGRTNSAALQIIVAELKRFS